MTKASSTIKRHAVTGALFVAAMFASSWASAATISCPNPLTGNQDREYQTSGASDCVWGANNIGQGNPGNDAFLLGQGTNDAAYGNSGPTFGKTWSTIDSQNYGNNSFPAFDGLTFSNVDSDAFNWLLTDTDFDFYALGLKDGGDPKWAVFLLSGTSGLAEIVSQGGSWSHVVLYGANGNGGGPGNGNGNGGGPGNGNGAPEPATLALVGLGLLGAIAARRRQRQ